MKRLIAPIVFVLCAQMSAAPVHAAGAIRPFTSESLSQIKAAHAGGPYVIFVWSLDCSYCQESFAALAQAQRQHGIKVVTIATDRAGDEASAKAIRKKIDASGLAGETWAFGPAPAEQLRFALDPNWRGELPRSYWFGAKTPGTGYSGVVTTAIVQKYMAF
jgi:hypothetical protein